MKPEEVGKAIDRFALKIEARIEAAREHQARMEAAHADALTDSLEQGEIAEAFRALSEIARERVSNKAERLVTQALKAVFNRPYAFLFDWTVNVGKRDATTVKATPLIESHHGDRVLTESVLDAHGGGLVDVVSFVLRLVVAMHTPNIERVLVLDEPFRHLSEEHAEGIAWLLNRLADKTGWQFIICTHQRRVEQAAHRVFRVKLNKVGSTTVTVEDRPDD